MITVSIIETGAGSSGVSARPIFLIYRSNFRQGCERHVLFLQHIQRLPMDDAALSGM
ncbi:MAG: hypothetical protein R3C26_11745 [Calditrichia bacterium]